MTPLERYRATVAGQPVDHLARTPILMQFAAEFIGNNYGAYAADYRVLTEAKIACVRAFGGEQVDTMSDPYCETQAFGAKILYEPNMVPRCEKHPLGDDPDQSQLLQPDPATSERMRNRIEAVRCYKRLIGGEYSIMGWVEGPAAEAADLRRLDNFFMDLMDEPGRVGDLMDLCVDVALEFARAQIDAGADTIGIGDAAASQVSRELYESLILPREQRLVRGLKEMGAVVRLHICGNITHLLPGIASLGIDILDVDHMVDLRAVRHIVGPRVALGGNLDPVAEVLRSKPEPIRARLREAFAEAGFPFFVNAGCEIPSGTPEENLSALCEPVPFS